MQGEGRRYNLDEGRATGGEETGGRTLHWAWEVYLGARDWCMVRGYVRGYFELAGGRSDGAA